MYSRNQPKSPPLYGQQPPATGIPIFLTNQQHYPTQNYMQQPAAKVPWSTGLCDCFSDVHNCCVTSCCPCITFGKIAEIVDQGSTSCGSSGGVYGLLCSITGFACLYSCIYRSRMRSQFMLETSPCEDCCVHFCCEPCALCQEYRELKSRGFDMSLGWNGNMQRQQNSGVPTAPVVESGMRR